MKFRSNRDREPSRIPIKILILVFDKSRNVRHHVLAIIKKRVPKSSRIHDFVKKRLIVLRLCPDNKCTKLRCDKAVDTNDHMSVLFTLIKEFRNQRAA